MVENWDPGAQGLLGSRDLRKPLGPQDLRTLGKSTVINRDDNQRHMIGYTWIEKDSRFT